jgi:hypothetical protein
MTLLPSFGPGLPSVYQQVSHEEDEENEKSDDQQVFDPFGSEYVHKRVAIHTSGSYA